MTATKTVKVTILRFNPQKDKESHYETYEAPFVDGMAVLNAVQHVSDNIDGGLAYHYSCRNGKCGGCTVMIDGKAGQICTTPLRGDVTLEPMKGFAVVKDLIVDTTKKV